MQKKINGALFRKMIITGAKLLESNREKVDSLNVFPVPDGDTGTNMSLTMQSVLKELNATQSNNLEDIAEAVSKGALKGARGNSGVILSQIFKGFCNSLKNNKEISVKNFADALKSGASVAYGAVSVPKEGTILTVIRVMSEDAPGIAKKSEGFEDFFPQLITCGEVILSKTPDMLPVLKKAGVVDSGGYGLLTLIKGLFMGYNGEEVMVDLSIPKDEGMGGDMEHADIMELGDIEFGYCTEFFIIHIKANTTTADIDKLREKLCAIGDSVICIGDLELVKVHVHTNTPNIALGYALELGELDKLKIENMLEQNRQLKAMYEAQKKEQGMLAISVGAGLSEIFKDLTVDKIIEGGQTMNPSANDIAEAVRKVNASHVFIFPNNKNIILAAEQAKSLVESKTIHVIPTKNIPQGIAAALNFDPDCTVEENKVNMCNSIENVDVGQVTYAVRDTNLDGFELKKGDIIGLDNKTILSKGDNIENVVDDLIKKMKNASHQIITLYYGEDVTDEDAQALAERLAEEHPDCDVDVHSGGQPIYYYIVSLE